MSNNKAVETHLVVGVDRVDVAQVVAVEVEDEQVLKVVAALELVVLR